MNLDWTTFVLEIINFLVLVWLLKRFLYRPVRRIIDQRQAQIAADVAHAEKQSAEAQQLLADYEQRFRDQEQERLRAREQLEHEIHGLREQKLAQLQQELDAERQRLQALDDHQQQVKLHQLESQALGLGARFASQLLGELASPALCQQLAQLALEKLQLLPAQEQQALHSNGSITVTCSHALESSIREALEAQLLEGTEGKTQVHWQTDPQLLAGIAIVSGDLRLDANLQAELKLFQDTTDGR